MNPDFDLYQEVVVEHKRAPRNFGELPEATNRARGKNPSCGDDVSVELCVADDRIEDIRFHGVGCAICMASASLMTEAIKGQSVEHALDLQGHFRALMTGSEDASEEVLGKLVSLTPVRRYPSRIKCALLGWHALAHAIQGDQETATGESAILPEEISRGVH